VSSSATRWKASPLLVDDSVPPEVVAQVVHSTPREAEDLLAVLCELNLRGSADPAQTLEMFLSRYEWLWAPDRPAPYPVSTGYVRCLLTRPEIRDLLRDDASRPDQAVFRIWPDYVLRPQIDRSVSTIKADAAARTFGSGGEGVVWAVLDTGIDRSHPHFSGGTVDDPLVRGMHRDFSFIVRGEPEPSSWDPGLALVDTEGHGTHVAGIIAGRLPADHRPLVGALQPTLGDDEALAPRWVARDVGGRTLAGVAPAARLVSLKVLDDRGGAAVTCSSAVIAALEYVRRINAWGRSLRIHGVNLSLGCRWFARDYAAGQSPLCRELDLLVGTGVVAVVSAGNEGMGGGPADPAGLLSTITDPANAAGAITVGSTHRDSPHLFGVTYSSSKGPTLDGRLKPDVLAPGEHITSCASGRLRARVPLFEAASAGVDACYAEESGTSMAAPHVSGAIAAFLSARSEYIGRPDEVKSLFCRTAVSLGRDRFFEGHGLVDLLAAMSRV
jgi:subtilisin family serine protease